ncbi:transferase [Anabaena subtropica]|uniref:Transferase n=1 Tax=Anabaena subtropica FACHB-260 TaxID=2692884 RepID=A0ABR8CN05_9NOST|nr:transferase [Anabaena subtropica]MBD2343739.1 transferase [Anabaena subtropica FACHB-260]
MSVPPLRLHNNLESYISGEVTIHPSAVIAPGVILQAAANSKIIIGAGVCIGMGSILQVNEGSIEVEAGASLGAGFLMVGQGKIGMNACVGAATTLFNCSIAPGLVVPPGSIVGDTTRQIDTTEMPESSTNHNTPTNTQQPKENETKVITSTTLSASAFVEFKQHSVSETAPPAPPENQSATVEQNTTNGTEPNVTPISPEDSESGESATESSNTFGTQIYGQGSIQRLLVTLFPHRQALNNPVSDDGVPPRERS